MLPPTAVELIVNAPIYTSQFGAAAEVPVMLMSLPVIVEAVVLYTPKPDPVDPLRTTAPLELMATE